MYLDFSNIGQTEIEAVSNALRTGYVSTHGPLVPKFEKAMVQYLKVPDAVATNSGTSALHLTLLATGIGPGDEVILPVLTFVSTVEMIKYVGAKPVFVDVDRETWCIDSKEIYETVTPKTKAIIGVNLYGTPCHWIDIAWRAPGLHGLWFIEDAAESLGCGQGYEPDFQCYSFNGNKIITTGSGGLVVSKTLGNVRQLAYHGKSESNEYEQVGYNYRMNNIQAALGLAQLKRLDEFLAKKKRFAEIYYEELSNVIEFQQHYVNTQPSHWYTAGLLPEGVDIPDIMQRLSNKGIPIRRVFKPLNQEPIYRDNKSYPVAEEIYRRGICLPVSTLNTEEDIYKACQEMKKLI